MKSFLFTIFIYLVSLFFGLVLVLLSNNATSQDIVLSTYETSYGDYGRYRGRAHNIRHASSFISAVTLQPGERFSFNETVGQRTRNRGFRRAPVIISGRMVPDYGGGVCQLASTIYAAALYAGLTIIEHHPHSRISSYIRPGLDATVDWNSKDLVLENPFSFPVTIYSIIVHGRSSAEEIIHIDIEGSQRPYNVRLQFYRRRLSTFTTIEEVDQNLRPGTRRIEEPGTPRMYVVVRRFFETEQGSSLREQERFEFIYEASNRIVLIGPRNLTNE